MCCNNMTASRCWTREMASSTTTETLENTFPHFDLSQIKPLMPGHNIWDAWFVLNEEDAQIADVFGYRVLVALGCEINSRKTRLMYFISRDGVHYKAGGRLINNGNKYIDDGVSSTPILPDGEEWSGSSIFREGRYIQTFYTLASGYQAYGIWQKRQQFATVTHSLAFHGLNTKAPILSSDANFDPIRIPKGSAFATVEEVHTIIAEPDDECFYQTADSASKYESENPTHHRWDEGDDQVNNFCFRDPKFIKDKGSISNAFLLFEANTGARDFCGGGKTGIEEGHYDQNFIGSNDFAKHDKITPDAIKANGCIGLLRLNNPVPSLMPQGNKLKYSAKVSFFQPLFYSNFVTDEIERINLIEHNDYYYLFFTTHSNKMAFSGEGMINRDMLIGFRSTRPIAELDLMELFAIGRWQPLNGNGVVLQQKSPGPRYEGQDKNPQYVYSWMVLPDLTVLCYSNFSTDEHGNIQPVKTMGPSIKLDIRGTRTRIASGPIYNFKPAM